MLGKTANGLFWMYRYLERAENTARLIETGQRISLTRLNHDDSEWDSVLQSAGCHDGFSEAYDALTKENAIDWLLRNTDNGSSVRSCINAARHNARQVRTAITGDVWEATNATYMSASEILRRRVGEQNLPGVLKELRQKAALVRGATLGTMLRNEIYDFSRLGTYLERADNSARILDVKYYVLLPSTQAVGTSIDNVQWESILRSLSARGGFRMTYGANLGPREIAHFLILDRRMPRSLVFCLIKLADNLDYLQGAMPGATTSQHLAWQVRDETLALDIDRIFEEGLHEFLVRSQTRLAQLAGQIEQDFRFYK